MFNYGKSRSEDRQTDRLTNLGIEETCRCLKTSKTIPGVHFVTDMVNPGENYPINFPTELPQDY